MIGRILIVAAALTLASEPALAQDPDGAPAHGQVALAAGFAPDPQTVSFEAEGEAIDVSSLSGACTGLIGETADVNLDYTAGNNAQLFISVVSQAPTALLLRGPNGAWYCGAGGGSAPTLHFARPQTGRYSIWVASAAGAQDVELRFSANLAQ